MSVLYIIICLSIVIITKLYVYYEMFHKDRYSPILIFKAGTRVDANDRTVTIDTDDLIKCATVSNKNGRMVPIVVGHPYDDSPAYGWASHLFVVGDQLYATPVFITRALAKDVQRGFYKKVSASFYLPGWERNPYPDVYTLKHIAILGATAPALKDLPNIVFNRRTM